MAVTFMNTLIEAPQVKDPKPAVFASEIYRAMFEVSGMLQSLTVRDMAESCISPSMPSLPMDPWSSKEVICCSRS
jgi:hypothetical protein